MTNQGDDRESCAREAVRRARRNVPWLFSKEDNRQFSAPTSKCKASNFWLKRRVKVILIRSKSCVNTLAAHAKLA